MLGWSDIMSDMLGLRDSSEIPDSLYVRLSDVNILILNVGGRLKSRQAIAVVVEQWRRDYPAVYDGNGNRLYNQYELGRRCRSLAEELKEWYQPCSEKVDNPVPWPIPEDIQLGTRADTVLDDNGTPLGACSKGHSVIYYHRWGRWLDECPLCQFRRLPDPLDP